MQTGDDGRKAVLHTLRDSDATSAVAVLALGCMIQVARFPATADALLSEGASELLGAFLCKPGLSHDSLPMVSEAVETLATTAAAGVGGVMADGWALSPCRAVTAQLDSASAPGPTPDPAAGASAVSGQNEDDEEKAALVGALTSKLASVVALHAAALLAAGSHIAVLRAMQRFSSSGQVVISACNTLAAIAAVDERVHVLVAAGAVDDIAGWMAAALVAGKGVVTVEAVAALNALRSIAAVDQRSVMACGAASQALGLARHCEVDSTEGGDASVVCCGLIRNLAMLPDHRAPLLAAGCAEMAAAVLRKRMRDPAAVLAAAGALVGLACDPASRVRPMELGVAALAGQAMDHVVDDAAAAWALCGAICKLAGAAQRAGDTACLKQLQAEGAGSALTAAVWAHPRSLRVVRAASSALTALASAPSNVPSLMEQGAAAAVSDAANALGAAEDAATAAAKSSCQMALAVLLA